MLVDADYSQIELRVLAHMADDKAMQEYIRASERTAVRLKNLSDDMFNYFLVFGGELSDAEPM